MLVLCQRFIFKLFSYEYKYQIVETYSNLNRFYQRSYFVKNRFNKSKYNKKRKIDETILLKQINKQNFIKLL